MSSIIRKVTKSIRQRGISATIFRVISFPFVLAYFKLKDLSPARIARRKEEADFDRRYQVKTIQDNQSASLNSIDSENWQHGTGYQGAPIETLTRIIEFLEIDYTDFTFVDIGSGKGRSLFVASNFPFARIVGIEYSKRLNEIANSNIQSFKNDSQKCHDLVSIHLDAMEFEFPNSSCVLFFNQPFGIELFAQLVDRLNKVLDANPRSVFVVYFDSQCESVFDSNHRFNSIKPPIENVPIDKEKIRIWKAG